MIAAQVRGFDLARAADLARAGEYDAAVRILDDLGRDPDTLDLLARIHAQRGDFAAAATAWSEVLAQEPANPSALAGTKLVTAITEGKRRARPLPLAAAGSAAVVVAALAGVLVAQQTPAPPPQAAVAPAPATQPVAVTPDPRKAALRSLMTELAGAHVRLEQHDDGVHVVFQQGMFLPDSTELSPEGRGQLERWGSLLRGKEVQVTVFGHGVVVPGGPTTGGSATALARAAAAIEVLGDVGEQPATAFAAQSADQAEAPHAGGDPALNRTVSVLVEPR
ncbi:hypothetical protein SAMN04488074_10420 [Lentzea albidocapillata subsp. violacea]|uniref:Tetratricopeptide repeat-containing protein n=1 Tax=Lentzea albidocapillata subsp. violacea TaxID=128104 RepID=A0A1G8YE63_9PSEU|nr:hypothetical protein [Lentzea albidocapillata]SDK01001.1 hypothetical protein SAMN04488074_10420 [Lentzea albidocapillata subsp. violacea]